MRSAMPATLRRKVIQNAARNKLFPHLHLFPVRTPSAEPASRLTREFGVPLYQQIQHLVRHRITTGHYAPGAQIPSENDLCRELNVSRVTLREALRELVRDDMLVKICLLYTSDAADERSSVDLGGRRI